MALIFLPSDLFTPGIQGQVLANQQNWNDLNQYNTVQQGQLNNLTQLATLGPTINAAYNQDYAQQLNNLFATDTYGNRVQQVNDATVTGNAAAQQAIGNLQMFQAGLPGAIASNQAQSQVLVGNAEQNAALQQQAFLQNLAAQMAQAQYTQQYYANGGQPATVPTTLAPQGMQQVTVNPVATPPGTVPGREQQDAQQLAQQVLQAPQTAPTDTQLQALANPATAPVTLQPTQQVAAQQQQTAAEQATTNFETLVTSPGTLDVGRQPGAMRQEISNIVRTLTPGQYAPTTTGQYIYKDTSGMVYLVAANAGVPVSKVALTNYEW